MAASRDEIMRALEGVIDPELRRPVTELDMVRDVRIDGGDVVVTIALTIAGCPLRDSFQQQVGEVLSSVEGVERVALEFDVMTPEERAALTARLRGGVTERSKGISLDRKTRVLAIASGKGGVGKSTLSVNLAAAFAQLGKEVGVLDADVYGHSIPHMLGISQRPVVVDKMIVPPVKDGLKLMSIGFFLDENAPVMWRGPMLHRALEQFLSDVHWGELDLLVVDMPPGTGDVSISLGQLLPRAEVVVVTTPQPAAKEVAMRAALMAQKTNMRLIGVVENMSGDVFGRGGGAVLADELDVPLLGEVPLDPRVREQGDLGTPIVSADPDAAASVAMLALAEAIEETRREAGRRHRQGVARRLLSAAAFFDLDRTLLRRSSTLALAPAFRRHGVITRSQVAKAAFWQLVFVLRGTSRERVRAASEEGLMLLRGFTTRQMEELVAETLEPVLRPLVYGEPLALLEEHRRRGEPSYIVSAALQEVVEALARELGFDGALGTVCEVEDGVYTGRGIRSLHGENKAAAVRELAAERGYDLRASTAYSDSHTDLPFLEVVGNPVVVNPDRELRRVAQARGWPVLRFSARAA